MIPKILPKGTTIDEWQRYELELHRHEVKIQNKRDFLERIIREAEKYGLEHTEKVFTQEIDKEAFMDAPNEPGYYRANND